MRSSLAYATRLPQYNARQPPLPAGASPIRKEAVPKGMARCDTLKNLRGYLRPRRLKIRPTFAGFGFLRKDLVGVIFKAWASGRKVSAF